MKRPGWTRISHVPGRRWPWPTPCFPNTATPTWQTSWLASDQAAHRALALNPNDADAYAALSYNQFSQRHYSSMVEPMQRALELAPENSAVSYWAANELAAMGRTRDAETRLDAALANDPANPLLLFYKSMIRWREGDQAGALDFIHRSGTADSPFGELMLGFYDAAHGDKEGAKRSFARSTRPHGHNDPRPGTAGNLSRHVWHRQPKANGAEDRRYARG